MLKTGSRRLCLCRRVGIWACLAGLTFLTGCGKRDTAARTVGIDNPERTWVRVLLFGNLRECTVTAPAGFRVRSAVNDTTAVFSDTGDIAVSLQDGRIRIGEHTFHREVLLCPNDPFYMMLDGRGFRGNLQFRVAEDANSIQVINHVPLESYLMGVVGAEMHSYWEPEALKAQAVAARTYCLAIQHRFGGERLWDVTCTQANQVYNGMDAENARVRQAVLDTTGQILIGPAQDGTPRLFAAYYGSSCGGHTEDSRMVFGEDFVNLPGVACPWCRQTARRRDFYWGPVFYTMETISNRLLERYASLQRLERITDVEVIQTGALGRITQVQLIGVNGRKDWLRGEDFRLSLDPTGRRLRSTLVTVVKSQGGLRFEDGRGFGHGVGLCQYGAQGLARKGCDYDDILAFYYPDATLVTIQTTAAQ